MRRMFGVTAAGELVESLVLQNASGVEVHLLTLGGALHQILLPDREGRRANVLLSLPDVAACERDPFFGAIIGRYANRLSGGGCCVDGRFVPLATDGLGVMLHGGAGNFSTHVWQADRCSATNAVTFHHTSPDGDHGFPGTLTVTATYRLGEGGLDLLLHASCDRATPLNLSVHPYFNLSGGRASTIHAHHLTVHAEAFTPIRADQLPTGAIEAVAGTALDFRRAAPIGQALASREQQIALGRGLNHNFVLARAMRSRPHHAVSLHDPASGRRIEMWTDRPGVQIYTANWFDGSMAGLEGRPMPRHAGVAIEPQHFPDSVHHPAFPQTILREGDVFASLTRFTFGVRD